MSEKTVKIPKQLETLDNSLKVLNEKPSFDKARNVVNNVISLLGVDVSSAWKPFNDSQGKIRSNAGWFMVAEGFADKRAAYKLAENNPQNIDLKCYWMKTLNKSVISWLVALTPNFEDEPFYGNLNIGIDFVIPEDANRVLVVLSKDYVIRTVELQGQLSVTQQEIFNTWLVDFEYSNKAQVHGVLWKSFDLEPVNKSFYKGISAFFVELKQFLSGNAKIFDDKHAAYFTNRLIGRIVFCWFLNKKGIVNPEAQYFNIGKLDATEYYRKKLEVLFFRVFNTPIEERGTGIDAKTPFLNGGLFEVKTNDRFEDPALIFPKDYFDRFFQFLNHYNFTTDESTSTFQQVAIDPEMLGRIFENLLAEQVEETGEQARKAKGAFYTPREIVDYMCRESLREYLKTKIPEDELRDQRIGLLLDVKPHEYRDQQRNFRRDLTPYKYDILKALDEIKIIDPACGSGAFPMGMLHILLDIYDRLDATFDPYKKKIEIIKNNLFGVDIEPMAVEICRLRVWLSIIVDEDSDSKKIEPLPNLDFKFICANSLIPLKGEDSKGLFDIVDKDELVELRDKYFNARALKSKDNIKRKFEKKIGYGDRQHRISSEREKQLRTYHPFDLENVTQFFDGEFIFGVKDGFDIVMGNPPYVNISNICKEDRVVYRGIYDITRNKIDLYAYFVDRGMMLLKKEGILTFIVSHTWKATDSFIKFREKILTYYMVKKIVNLNLGVFDANVKPLIIMLVNNRCNNYFLKIFNDGFKFKDEIYIKEILKEKDYAIDTTSSDAEKKLLHKIQENAVMLGDICKFTRGIKTSNDKKFIKHVNAGEDFKKVIRGRDIFSYGFKWNEEYVWYRPDLMKEKPGCLPHDKDLFETDEKIILKRISKGLVGCYDNSKIYSLDTTLVSRLETLRKNYSLKYILALINSSLLNYWYHKKFSLPTVSGYELHQLPIGKALQEEQKKIIAVVDKILHVREEEKEKRLNLISEIDQIVFRLYNITIDEQKIVLGVEGEE